MLMNFIFLMNAYAYESHPPADKCLPKVFADHIKFCINLAPFSSWNYCWI